MQHSPPSQAAARHQLDHLREPHARRQGRDGLRLSDAGAKAVFLRSSKEVIAAYEPWQGSRQLPSKSRTAATDLSSVTRLASNERPNAPRYMRDDGPPFRSVSGSFGGFGRRALDDSNASPDARPASAASMPQARNAGVIAPAWPPITARPRVLAYRESSVIPLQLRRAVYDRVRGRHLR